MEISVAAHDTTGGMETKILEAAVIARLGIDVYITKVRMFAIFAALKHENSGLIANYFRMYVTPCIFDVFCDTGWNSTLAEGIEGGCEHGL